MKKKKPTKSNKTYIFRIILVKDSFYCKTEGVKGKVWRDIAILDNQSLYDFAESIVGAFGFYFDHCFGFFDNLKKWTDSKNMYELFADLEDEGIEPTGAGSVEKTKVNEVWQNKGDKMLFLFDYGDNWEFIVSLKKIEEPNFEKLYPQVIKKIGKPPEQYPSLDEDDAEDEG